MAVLERIRSEYLEMPGLRLKREQVQRLCGLDRAICEEVLDALVEMECLSCKPDGAYVRVADGIDIPWLRAEKASLSSELPVRVPEGVAADVRRRVANGPHVEPIRARAKNEWRRDRCERC
ncbi:MAG TPA: hypothetical protein VD833_16715 [Vicinamibacterales bacterium]|nr:hypothetical protein [Vicinamibacterales bacterium]